MKNMTAKDYIIRDFDAYSEASVIKDSFWFEIERVMEEYAAAKVSAIEKVSAITKSSIVVLAAAEWGTTTAGVMSKSQKREYVVPRDAAIYLIKEYLSPISETALGDFFNRDHSSINASIRRTEDHLETDRTFKHKVEMIEKRISSILNNDE